MFKNLTIKSQLIFVIALLSVLLIGIGGLGLFGMNKANDGIKTVYLNRAVPMGQISEIQRLIERDRLEVVSALGTQSARNFDIEADIAQIAKIWGAYMATTLTPEEVVIAKRFAENRRKFTEEGLRPAVEALRAGDFEKADSLLAETIQPLHMRVTQDIEALMKLQLDVAGQEYERAGSRYATLRTFSMAAIVFGVLLAAMIGFFLVRTITRRLKEASGAAQRVASGDLSSSIEVHSKDEIGQLLLALQTMQDNLRKTVGTIKESTDTINTASQEIAAGNADLSQRTEEQASSLEETASSMEELTSTVKQNAENAKQANQLAAGASEVAVKGGTVVGQVVKTMSSINESSKKIVDIISVIDGIAFQTNILALNAAVEAARAGEQGRGFAVVATEVRNLAQRSAAAAKEIKVLIDDSVEKVGAGTKLVDEAGKTMGEIVSSVKRVTDIMAEISAASQEQSSGIEQVNRTVTQMDEVTQQNAALVEEAAAAAESMQEQAQNLTQAVSVFKLAQDEARAPVKAEKPAVSVTHLPARDRAATKGQAAEEEKPAAPKMRKVANARQVDEEWQEF